MIVPQQTERPQEPPHPPAASLNFYEEGATVVITEINGGKGVNKRLKELGLGEGQVVTIIKNNRPGGLVLEVMDTKLCIGHGIALKIKAEEKTW